MNAFKQLDYKNETVFGPDTNISNKMHIYGSGWYEISTYSGQKELPDQLSDSWRWKLQPVKLHSLGHRTHRQGLCLLIPKCR